MDAPTRLDNSLQAVGCLRAFGYVGRIEFAFDPAPVILQGLLLELQMFECGHDFISPEIMMVSSLLSAKTSET